MLWRIASLGIALWIHVRAAAAGEEYESPDLKGLMIEVTKLPENCPMKSRILPVKDYVEVHYTTSIAQSSKTGVPGKKLDTSRDADNMNDPLSFQVGSRRVVPGFDHGVRDMCEGEIRGITIPPEHAYGEDGYEQKNSDGDPVSIPANATIRIDAELIKIIRLEKDSQFMPEKCEKKAVIGNTLKVHYTLYIHKTSISGTKGKKLESSREGKNAGVFDFVLGAQKVIPGWDQALVGVCEGEKMELVVPPEFGYGTRGSPSGNVPPLATLRFELEVVEVVKNNMFEEMDTNADGKIDLDELGAFMKKKQGLKDLEIVKKIMDGEDKNKDGFIDWDEAPFPKGDKPPTKEEL